MKYTSRIAKLKKEWSITQSHPTYTMTISIYANHDPSVGFQGLLRACNSFALSSGHVLNVRIERSHDSSASRPTSYLPRNGPPFNTFILGSVKCFSRTAPNWVDAWS